MNFVNKYLFDSIFNLPMCYSKRINAYLLSSIASCLYNERVSDMVLALVQSCISWHSIIYFITSLESCQHVGEGLYLHLSPSETPPPRRAASRHLPARFSNILLSLPVINFKNKRRKTILSYPLSTEFTLGEMLVIES